MPAETEFWFNEPQGGRCTVGIIPSHYDKSVATANELAKKLTEQVPRPHEVLSEPYVEIMGGRRSAGKMSVRMYVELRGGNEQATRMLAEAGFCEGLDRA